MKQPPETRSHSGVNGVNQSERIFQDSKLQHTIRTWFILGEREEWWEGKEEEWEGKGGNVGGKRMKIWSEKDERVGGEG